MFVSEFPKLKYMEEKYMGKKITIVQDLGNHQQIHKLEERSQASLLLQTWEKICWCPWILIVRTGNSMIWV